MRVEIDDRSGFCSGVVKAIEMAEKMLEENSGGVASLGDIVHNRLEMERLERLGLRTISHAEMEDRQGAMVLIRAHGEPPSTYEIAKKNAINIVDATCPVVASLQKVVAEAHRRMTENNGQVVILGKKGHAEVVGLTGQVSGGAPVIVAENVADLDMVDFARPVYLLSQTTQSLGLFRKMSAEIRRRIEDPDGFTVHDTICRRVAHHEAHLKKFAADHDVIIFVSGRKSSNGKLLFEACLSANPKSYMIEDENDMRAEWFDGVESVGICGATSTPKWLMQSVAQAVESY